MNTITLERRDETNEKRTLLAVVGPLGAIHYWHQQSADKSPWMGRDKFGGVESHSRDGHGVPDQENCWLLEGPCWHDGSSLYADEVFIPLWERCTELDDMEPFWKRLENEYHSRFGGDE